MASIQDEPNVPARGLDKYESYFKQGIEEKLAEFKKLTKVAQLEQFLDNLKRPN